VAHLVLTDIRKRYGEVATIHGVDLEVRDGEFMVFVGPSGCGKSTLLRMIAGLEEVTAGELRIDGAVVNGLPASERGLAMVFQSYALYPHMSVYKNMAFGLENMRMPRDEIERRVRRAGEMLRLTEYFERKPGQLSGGQRQRVAIGRAIVRDPKIFLFDEPLSNLDAELRVSMRKELAALHAELGGTMIYVTHDQTEAMTLADRIVVLRAGRIEQVGAPLELYNRPDNLFVAGFIGSPRMNLIGGSVGPDGRSLVLPNGPAIPLPGPTLSPGSTLTLGVRPEHVAIAAPGGGDLSATVDLVEQLGGETLIYATVPGLSPLTVRETGQARRARGDAIGLAFDRAHLHLFGPDERRLPEPDVAPLAA
jgi:ABC-type sugar transport system ATPase subunit